jgi:hypothetical protein
VLPSSQLPTSGKRLLSYLRRRMRSVFAALCSVVVACDPASQVASHISLRPAPISKCLDSALGASPLVFHGQPHEITVVAAIGLREVAFSFNDSVASHFSALARTTLKADSVVAATVAIGWRGALRAESDQTRSRLAALSSSLLRELVTACALQPIDTLSCVELQILPNRRRACRA